MSLPVVFRREAQDELDEAYSWYEQQISAVYHGRRDPRGWQERA